jgi:uncharacterized NAD(P)/FAD-binding protein YdhS
MSTAPQLHIAIVGGGFSGTLVAVNLARLAPRPLKITLINCAYPQGRGIAYGTQRPEHLLNVAARNMSALPDHPQHFVEWLRTRTEFAGVPEAELRETFIPRRVYGDYVRSLALHYLRPLDARSLVEIATVEEEVVALAVADGSARLTLAGGGTLAADRVVLATGNEPPADLPGTASVAHHAGWFPNPWIDWSAQLPAPTETIALLGTGLTTVDAIVTLLALNWRGRIVAVSRNGLLPQSHFKGVDDPLFPPADTDLARLGLVRLARLMEEHCERLRLLGNNPAMIVDKLRPHTQRIWQGFTDAERHEFIARYAARWNVIRHRIAPSIHRDVTGAVDSGRVQIARASIVGLRPAGARIGIDLRSPDGVSSCLEAALVVNCTGPHTRFSATRSPLLRDLLATGLAQPDAMDMGIKVDSDFTVLQRDGARSPVLIATGPLLRGTLWESIAVPELRGQALRVAQTLLADASAPAVPAPAWSAEPAVIEYCI